jgi:hypothetical protein
VLYTGRVVKACSGGGPIVVGKSALYDGSRVVAGWDGGGSETMRPGRSFIKQRRWQMAAGERVWGATVLGESVVKVGKASGVWWATQRTGQLGHALAFTQST